MTGVLWLVAILLILLTVVDPRKLWYSTTAWQDRLDSAGDAAARELTGEYGTYSSPGITAIEEALGRDDVRVREDRTVNADAPFGESYGIQEYYELTGVDDDSIAGCLEVAYDGGLFHEGDTDVSVGYASGPC